MKGHFKRLVLFLLTFVLLFAMASCNNVKGKLAWWEKLDKIDQITLKTDEPSTPEETPAETPEESTPDLPPQESTPAPEESTPAPEVTTPEPEETTTPGGTTAPEVTTPPEETTTPGGTTPEPEPEEEIWELVTDGSTLQAGDKIVIVAKDFDVALSTNQKSNNRGQAVVTKNGNVITFGDDVQILVLETGKINGTFAFNTGSGYLYAASSSSNYLRTETALSDNSSWSITISTDGTAAILAQGTNARNVMQYNQSSTLFACYASASQKAIVIYKLSTDSEPACEHTYDNACDTTCNKCNETREVPAHVYDNACDITCNVCQAVREVPAHVYDNACDTTCNVCQAVRETSHNYTTKVTSPTCTTVGYTTYTCGVCGHSYTGNEVQATGHNYVNGKCTVCQDIDDGHTHTYDNACDKNCNICGAERIPEEHKYDNACDTTCNVCQAVREVSAHVEVIDEAVAATCAKPGKTEGKHCSVCGAVLVAQQEVAIKDHTDTNNDYLCDNYCETIMPPAADSVLTIEQAIALGKLYKHDNFTAKKYYITGVIESITNTTFGNLYIKDANGNKIYVYGFYSADGSTCYGDMATKPVVGDTVTIYTIVGSYNDAPELKDVWMKAHTPAVKPEEPEQPEIPELPEGAIKETLNIFASTGALAEDDDSISWNFDNFIVTIFKNGASDAIRVTDNNHYRFYAKNKLTLSAKNGQMIQQVIITVTANEYVENLVNSLKDAGYTVAVDGKVVTVFGINATTFEFQNTQSKQTRFSTIEVAFTSATAGGDDVCEHELETSITKEATCTEAGSKTITCKNCDYEKVESIPALGHTYGEWVETKAPTCTENGEKKQTCTRTGCEDVKTQIIYAGHNYVDGTCTKCGATQAAQTEATIVFDDTSKRTEFSNNIQVWQENGITITNNKGSSTSNVGDYSNPARFYKSSTVTIAYPGMTKIVINCTGENIKAEHVTPWSDNFASIEGAIVSIKDNIVTITLNTPVDSVTITMTAQSRATSITVYAEAQQGGEEEPCEHANTKIEGAVAATCTTAGHTGKTVCSDCGEIVSEGSATAILPHTEETVPGKAATCTENGLTDGKKCSVCGEIIKTQETIEANGHNMSNYVTTTAPTCTAKGEERSDCSKCDHYVTREIAIIDHTKGNGVVENENAPSCTVDGSYDTVVYCLVCTKELSRVTTTVKANGHTPVVDAAKAPTCEGTGLTEGSHCSACSEVLVAQKEVAAKGHNFGQWETTTPPTEEENGVETRKCENCDATETNVIPALGHKCELHPVDIIPEVKPTCTQPGLTAGQKCSGCGTILVPQETVPATGHTYSKKVTAPTCTKEGYTTYTCACGDNYTDDKVPATGHELVAGEITTAPTCTTNGVQIYECKNCEHSENKNVPATGVHTPGAAATCTTPQICTVCNTELNPALDHDMQQTVAPVEPTCGKEGCTEGKKCSRCDYEIKSQVRPATGKHTPGAAVVENKVDATCTKEGSYQNVVYCSAQGCGAEISRVTTTVDALGHNFDANGDCTACDHVVKFIIPNGVTLVLTNNKLPTTTDPNGYTFVGWSEEEIEETTTKPTIIEAGKYIGNATVLYAVYTRTETTPGIQQFEKVTSDPGDWSGAYLIVYEDGNVAFDGSLGKLDAAGNTISVTITNGVIAFSNELNNSTFIIVKTTNGYTIKSASGYYIGQTQNDNGLAANQKTTYDNTITINDDGTVNIVSGGAYLRFNAASNQNRFRYYKSGTYTNQKAIHLYKLVEESSTTTYYVTLGCDHSYTAEVTDPTCTADGYTTYTCKCGDSYTANVVPATGHDYDEEVTPPTCTEKGYTTHTCACGDKYIDSYVDTLPHVDENKDHECDVCFYAYTSCKDGDNDHNCDWCGDRISKCVNNDEDDHNCDICGKTVSECADNNNDHNCDVCNTPLSRCLDKDRNHKCDVCGDKMSECKDTDPIDHKCDWCGETVSECEDADSDHECDICGLSISDCADENKNHKCDICGDKMSECEDADKNHFCDWCGIQNSQCMDINSDHNCDWCGEKISECVDNNNDHKCDICNETLSTCADNNKDHKCDVCNKELSTCADGNNDHNCDVCGKTLTQCADGDKDHDCDWCGKEGITACVDGDPVVENNVDPTCTTPGSYEEVVYCSVCKAELSRTPKTIDAPGHNFGENARCSVCGELNEEHSHTYTNACDTTCNICGDVREVNDHVYDNTCDTTCNECGDVREITHTLTEKYQVVNEKLCLVDACGVCDYVNIKQTIDDVGTIVEVSNEADLKTVLYAGYSVKLIANIDLSTTIEIIGATVTINLNEKTLKADWESTGVVEVLHIHDGSNVTIIGEGNVVSGGTHIAGTNSVVSCRINSTLTIKGGNYYSASFGDVIFCETNSIVYIEGGHFEAKENHLGTWYILDIDETETDNRGKFIVTGGEFVKFNPASHINDGDYTNKVEDGYHSIYNEETSSYVVSKHTSGDAVTENNVDPTCTADGSYDNVIYCNTCGKELSRETITVDAKGHDLVDVEEVAKTCTKDGYTAHKDCKNCDYTEGKTVIPASHDLVDVEEVAKTCTKDGYTAHKACEDCDYTEGKETIPAGHDLVDVEAKAKTCTEDGYTAHKACENCDYTEGKTVLPAAHTIENKDAQEATCTEAGWNAYEYCSECDYTTKVEIPATGHTFVCGTCSCGKKLITESVTNKDIIANAGTTGNKTIYWTANGITFRNDQAGSSTAIRTSDSDHYRVYAKSTVTISGNNITKVVITCTADAAVCVTSLNNAGYNNVTRDGSVVTIILEEAVNSITFTASAQWRLKKIEVTCSTKYIPSEKDEETHEYTSEVTKPTCTEDGYTTHTCKCGNSYTDSEVEKLGHTEVIDQAVAPNCEETGLTQGKHCSVCKEVLVAQETVDALGHTDGEWIIDKEATAEESGSRHQVCSTCGATIKTETIPQLHTHSYEAVVTEPTCTTSGYTTYTCSDVDCRHSYVADEVPASHTYGDWNEENPATCKAEGVLAHYQCSACGDYFDKDKNPIDSITISALGHNFVDGNCTRCVAIQTSGIVATFEFGANGDATHSDGSNTEIDSYTETDGSYTLKFDSLSKIYKSARDAKGNSCIKLGTGSATASFSFSVPDDVTKVVIYVAGYKANKASVVINNTTYAINTTSDTGTYTIIEINTSTIKTIDFKTNSSPDERAMINTVEFYSIVVDECGGEHQTEVTDSKNATCTEAGYTILTCTTCGKVIKTTIPAKGHTEVEVPAVGATCTETGLTEGKKCSVCGEFTVKQTEIPAEHHFDNGSCIVCGEPDPNQGGSTEPVTESKKIYANQGSLSNKVITWTGDNFTFSNAQASSTSAIRTSDSDHFRVYAKSKVTIAVTSGTITEVVITCTSSSYASAMQTSAETAGYTVSVSGSTVTIKVDNKQSITFDITAQTRINNVAVTYTPA